jgi:multicomponent Na+:H+ antiporter subunit D
MKYLLLLILISPIIASICCLLLPKRLVYLTNIISSCITIILISFALLAKPEFAFPNMLSLNNLSIVFLPLVSFLFALISVYSFRINTKEFPFAEYSCFVQLILSTCLGIFLTNNLILLLCLLGLFSACIYYLLNLKNKNNLTTPEKFIIFNSGSDFLILFAIGSIWALTNSFQMNEISISLIGNNFLSSTSIPCIFLCLALLTKSIIIPFLIWQKKPEKNTHVSIIALLSTTLSTLIGLYLLSKFCLDLFVVNQNISFILLISGSIALFLASLFALFQQNLKSSLLYQTIGQTGLIIIGIGTFNPLGYSGAIINLINSIICLSALFLCSINIENKTKTLSLEKLGNLGKDMPAAFFCFLVAALSLAGIPPLLGFSSKWLIIQGILKTSKTTPNLWFFWIIIIVISSTLLLISLLKSIISVFLDTRTCKTVEKQNKKMCWQTHIPITALTIITLILGATIFKLPILKIITNNTLEISKIGSWQPDKISLIILFFLLIGLILHYFNKANIQIVNRLSYKNPVNLNTFLNSKDFLTKIKLTYFNIISTKISKLFNFSRKKIIKQKNKNTGDKI